MLSSEIFFGLKVVYIQCINIFNFCKWCSLARYVFICYALGIPKSLSHINSSKMDESQQDVKNFVKIRRQF